MDNHAFIDAQNVHMGIKALGWKLDWKRLRVYLKDKYKISHAYLFLGFLDEHQILYENLRNSGFILIFKPVVKDHWGKIKGNCDADLVVITMSKIHKYSKAVIVSSDGDFYLLVRYLRIKDKLLAVLSPEADKCSSLLKKEAGDKIYYMNNLAGKIGVSKQKGTA